MSPEVTAFFDDATFTISYVVKDQMDHHALLSIAYWILIMHLDARIPVCRCRHRLCAREQFNR